MRDEIIDLRETSPDHWQAKYQGNYGIYTIRITTDGKTRRSFSCTCPSDAYPCKHIGYIEDAIAERIAENTANGNTTNRNTLAAIINKLHEKELRAFLLRLARYNDDIANSVLLEFGGRAGDTGGNKYCELLREALANIHEVDYDDYYDYCVSLQPMDEWIDKARQELRCGNVKAAVQIAQACIEEYVEWRAEQDEDSIYGLPESYEYDPFAILREAADNVDKKALFKYCLTEAEKDKYHDTGYPDSFYDLMGAIAEGKDADAFLALQEQLFNELDDQSDSTAQHILEREINYYRRIGDDTTADKIVEDNIQIESFREQVIRNRIDAGQFAKAKKLILEVTGSELNSDNGKWNKLLLEIAQKQHDKASIRALAYLFIKDHFRENYYIIYKSTFTAAKWPAEFESLLKIYKDTDKYYDRSAAKLLAVENENQRLFEYISEHANLDQLGEYYDHFTKPPIAQPCLTLFRRLLDDYAEQNVGRSYYERIAAYMKKMLTIDGGQNVVDAMVKYYLVKYNNRRAMKEVLRENFGGIKG
jgi:hypothetical protein